MMPPRLSQLGRTSEEIQAALNMSMFLLIAAPSGAGKGAIVAQMVERWDHLFYSTISVTTRERRPHEVEGKHYYFVTQEEFSELAEAGEFIEDAEVHIPGNRYGTLKTEVLKATLTGKIAIVELDVQGVERIQSLYKERSMAIFITVPDAEEQERRLRERGTESEEQMKRRLANAPNEIAVAERLGIPMLCNETGKLRETAFKVVHNAWEFFAEMDLYVHTIAKRTRPVFSS